MSYWLREYDPFLILLGLAVSLAWSLGGLMMARHGFRLQSRERLLVGLGLGLSTYVTSANLIGRWLEPELSFPIAGGLVLGLGLTMAGTSRRALLARDDFDGWRPLVILALIALVTTLVGRGLGIFDDRKNLSIISLMAAGDIPPHFYMDADVLFRYHYGSQLFAASLMRLTGLQPWSALDLAKGALAGITLGLAYVAGRKLTHSIWGGLCVAGVALLASGSRWMLLQLPVAWIQAASDNIVLWGSGRLSAPTLVEALGGAWQIAGGPRAGLPFAHVNGILQPFTLGLHSTGISMTRLLLLLALLTAARLAGWRGIVATAMAMAAWALAWETDFLLFGCGALAAAGLGYRKLSDPGRLQARLLLVALGVALALALLQGGTITELVRQVALGADAGQAEAGFPISLRWPPAIVSAHLGELHLNRPSVWLVALAEIGLAVLAAPLVTWWGWRGLRRGRLAESALAAAALVGFGLAMLLRYEVDRDITRFSATGLYIWAVLGTGAGWVVVRRCRKLWVSAAYAAWVGLLVLPGIMTAGYLLPAIQRPVLSEDIEGVDARMSAVFWDRLEPKARVLGSHPWRQVVVLGRPTKSVGTDFKDFPSWRAAVSDPVPTEVARLGYGYVYMDQEWWDNLSPERQAEYADPCVALLALESDLSGRRRWLWDVRACAGTAVPE